MCKCLVITGSAEGIGLEIANVFLDSGYKVLGLDKDTSILEGRNNYFHLRFDLREILQESNPYERKIMKHLEGEVSELILVNNAATQLLGKFGELKHRAWKETFEVNLFVPVALVRLLESKLKDVKGSVVNVSSIHASLTKPEFSAYAASKAAVESLTRSLSLELALDGVRINAVAPAAISTAMLQEGFLNDPEGYARLNDMHPTGKIGSPKDLALFIKRIAELSDVFFNGAIIPYEGGIGSVLSDPSCDFSKKIEV